MAPDTYAQILARNIRAARSRVGIGQEDVAVRMQRLGYQAWIRQTVGATERERRRPTAEEVFALSLVLRTTITGLMAPTAEDVFVDLPSGAPIAAKSVYDSARGLYDQVVWWDGNEPSWVMWSGEPSRPPASQPAAMPVGEDTQSAILKELAELRRENAELKRQLEERG